MFCCANNEWSVSDVQLFLSAAFVNLCEPNFVTIKHALESPGKPVPSQCEHQSCLTKWIEKFVILVQSLLESDLNLNHHPDICLAVCNKVCSVGRIGHHPAHIEIVMAFLDVCESNLNL